jgi:phage shock protein PspC (stress-responsive transcriptional regulator)
MSAQSVLTREDTFFGVCFALGADFGFSPTYLRILFALLFFYSPAAALGAYGAIGAVVALSRWVAPDPAAAESELREEPVLDRPRAEASYDLPLAA